MGHYLECGSGVLRVPKDVLLTVERSTEVQTS